MAWRDDLESLGIEELRKLIELLIAKAFPEDSEGRDQEIQHCLDKIKETEDAKL